ncbi:MAG: lipoyl(octanoyl) transferase LipB [Myxococcota bacterium]
MTPSRAAKEEHFRVRREALVANGFEVHDVGRGGDVTYHGPGQLVGYPIVDLKPDRQDVRKYVASLEETMIRLAADQGLAAERLPGFNGAWLEASSPRARKIGAVGVRISRWVTMHGFAFNAAPKLGHFDLIVPCGIQDKGVTSVEAETGERPDMDALGRRAAEHFAALHASEVRVVEDARSRAAPDAPASSPDLGARSQR